MSNVPLTVGFALAIFFVVSFLKALKNMGSVPGYRPMLSPLTLLGATLPCSWWNLGLNWSWKMRETAFFKHTHDIITIIPWLIGDAAYCTCSPEVARQLLDEGKRQLIRPRKLTQALLLWGENVFSSNGDMWRKHRRVMSPAFNSKIYIMVLQQTSALYREMFDCEGISGKDSVVVFNFCRLPLRLAFLVIARCGFGMPLPWAVDEQEDTNKTNVNHALSSVTKTAILRLTIPSWLYRFPIKALRKIDQSWKSLAVFMHQSVEARAEELTDEPDLVAKRGDVFTRLVAATNENSKYRLEEDEVIGNTFMLMFAGHETTALVLTATFAYLSVYQDEQDKVHKEIISVIQGNREPTLEDLSKLPHTLACFTETLRLLPAAPMLTRTMPEDVVVKVKHPVETTMILKKGSLAIIDMINLHRNPHTYPDPHSFKPSRWYGVAEPEITMFGSGPRSCIGRKFGQIEALTFMSLFLRDWHVDVVLEDGETRQQYETRVLHKAGNVGLSFGVTEKVHLRLTKRRPGNVTRAL